MTATNWLIWRLERFRRMIKSKSVQHRAEAEDAARNDAAQAFVSIIAERITKRELRDLFHLAQKAKWTQLSEMLCLKLEN